MALRCLLFTSDLASSALICQVLSDLGVEAESCVEGPAAVEKVIHQSFQIVIIDWDMQPEAGLLLNTARERKATERPLTLAIVSDDGSVPKALQAGANSILRKPVLVNQAHDTLKTACDLLKARESAAQAAAAAASAAPRPACLEQGSETPLRAGEFLQTRQPAPGAQFVVESETQRALQQQTIEAAGPLKELEPMAGSVQEQHFQAPPSPPSPPQADEPRGLAWYLNKRAGNLPPVPQSAAAAAPAPAPEKPELIGYEQTPSQVEEPAEVPPAEPDPATLFAPTRNATPEQEHVNEQKEEAQLFAYITDGQEEAEKKEWTPFRFGKKAIVAAAVLAVCAIAAAPQAPWHPQMRIVWAKGRQTLHGWLNPQTATTPQATPTHESFERAGDEYKLPVPETIPDATTDPTQIRVTPVVDPTAKKPNNGGVEPDQTSQSQDGASPSDQGQAPAGQDSGAQSQQNPGTQPAETGTPASGTSALAPAPGTAGAAAAAAEKLRADSQAAAVPTPSPVAPMPSQPQPPINPLPHSVSTPVPTPEKIPSSLKSQMASMTPEASGNKAPEAALPSIEPVSLPEDTARGLLTDQPAPAYPESAKGQPGTVTLQVLIGRDGTVLDAKFLQGSLAFARAAIGGVKLWKFKPYMMNGRAVSVETNLTISFKPASR